MPYSADITSVRGIEAYYSSLGGKALASAVSDALASALGRETRGAMYKDLAVCRDPAVPSVLIEVGYMTSVEEYYRMLTEEGVNAAAEGIKNGILEYFADALR
jgi:N-acetylmuramoyl-L-alanine amidase